MTEFDSLKQEIKGLRKLLQIEREGYDKWFKNYHDIFTQYFRVISTIATKLELDNVKQMNLRCCCEDNQDNPIYKKLDKLLKKVGNQ